MLYEVITLHDVIALDQRTNARLLDEALSQLGVAHELGVAGAERLGAGS